MQSSVQLEVTIHRIYGEESLSLLQPATRGSIKILCLSFPETPYLQTINLMDDW